MTADRNGAPRRPHPDAGHGVGLRLELLETPDGWTLTLHTDAASAALLADVPAFVDGGPGPRAEISVRPNLVPGEPIPLAAVRVVVDDARRESATEGDLGS